MKRGDYLWIKRAWLEQPTLMSDGWVRYLAFLPDETAVQVRKSELPYWAAGMALLTFAAGVIMTNPLLIGIGVFMAAQSLLGANTTRRLVVAVSDPAPRDKFGCYRFARQ